MPQEITVYVDNLPNGSIIMWSGDVHHLPIGWRLCDGASSNVPDLRNRFLIGAGDKYPPGRTGGSDSISIKVNNLPSHTHDGKTNIDGVHSHDTWFDNRGLDTGDAQGLTNNSSRRSFKAQSDSNGSHVHSFTTNPTGSGCPIEFMPSYYAIYYIIKIE